MYLPENNISWVHPVDIITQDVRKQYNQFSKVNLVFFFNDVQKEHSD